MHQCTAEDDGRSFKDSTYDILCYEQYTVDKVCVNNISYIIYHIYIYLELPTYIYIYFHLKMLRRHPNQNHISRNRLSKHPKCDVVFALQPFFATPFGNLSRALKEPADFLALGPQSIFEVDRE